MCDSVRNRRTGLVFGAGWLATLAAIIGLGLVHHKTVAAPTQPVFTDIDYAAFDPARNTLDLYLPPKAKGRPPVVVWIHGGGWREGNKDLPVAAKRLLAEGFAVASINYRLSQHAPWPAQLEDVASAIRMLRGNGGRLGYDGSRIALFGASAGGHLAATAALAFAHDPTARVNAVVDWYGPTDLLQIDADLAALGRKSPLGPAAHPQSPVSQLIGAPLASAPDKAKAASPMTYVDGLAKPPPPFLIMHGDADDVIPAIQSARLHRALTEKFGDNAANYILIHGGTHGKGGFERRAAEDQVIRFLKAKLNA